MRSISLQQIRETFSRYVREERLASGRPANNYRWPEVPPSSDSASMTLNQGRFARLKAFLRAIPVVGPILVTAYRVVKLPGRVALIVRQLQNVYELQLVLTKLHERIDALAWQVSALQAHQESALRAVEGAAKVARAIEDRFDSISATAPTLDPPLREIAEGMGSMHDVWNNFSQVLVSLHEKTDRYQADLLNRVSDIKTVFHGGDNLIISRVDDFIMAFPSEEWRLPVYQILVGQLEPGLSTLMKSTIRQGMTVIDVGANVGTYTLLALRSIGSHGKVFSYEPTPRIFDILQNNVRINGFLETGRVDLRQKAAADGTQPTSAFFTSSNSLMNSLFGEDAASKRPVEIIEVETVSLDEDLAEVPTVDVVKVDAEGAEPTILRGMRRIIERSPGITIFIEFAPTHLVRAKVDARRFLEDIRSQGFTIQEVVEPTGELRAVTDQALLECFSVNLMLRRP